MREPSGVTTPSPTRRRGLRESSGCWRGLFQSPVVFGEVPDVDARWLYAERGECGADLAAMIGAVVQRLGEADAERSVAFTAVGAATHENGVGIEILGQQVHP